MSCPRFAGACVDGIVSFVQQKRGSESAKVAEEYAGASPLSSLPRFFAEIFAEIFLRARRQNELVVSVTDAA
jgi:hypothetical protein